jgi:hypothetical protein
VVALDTPAALKKRAGPTLDDVFISFTGKAIREAGRGREARRRGFR